MENADWNNSESRKYYYKLLDKKDKTEEEIRFCIDMYHQEEFYAYGEL